MLVGPDGRTHVLKDEDDLACAVKNGWLLPEEQAGARHGLEQLLGIIEGPGLVAFLEQVSPFRAMADGATPPPMAKLRLTDVPLLHPDTRCNYFGRRLQIGPLLPGVCSPLRCVGLDEEVCPNTYPVP